MCGNLAFHEHFTLFHAASCLMCAEATQPADCQSFCTICKRTSDCLHDKITQDIPCCAQSLQEVGNNMLAYRSAEKATPADMTYDSIRVQAGYESAVHHDNRTGRTLYTSMSKAGVSRQGEGTCLGPVFQKCPCDWMAAFEGNRNNGDE